MTVSRIGGFMKDQNYYCIDFTNVKYYHDMHRVIREAFGFPTYYGNNWDAFWDLLREMTGEAMHVQILGIDVIEKRFVKEADVMLGILKEFKHSQNDRYCEKVIIEIVRNKRSVFLS